MDPLRKTFHRCLPMQISIGGRRIQSIPLAREVRRQHSNDRVTTCQRQSKVDKKMCRQDCDVQSEREEAASRRIFHLLLPSRDN
ncbi:hypothetical protein AVEN_233115-1 [Araneus ventricosus]|uniref:Uncharacterized protein n=1 Tax=Araneus ventricosus TaxID=182803 RepID=A0A4Y2MSP3_ARAVE|nr:hypothetical protein AVEN_233115-1 [Araneus ventricosus]